MSASHCWVRGLPPGGNRYDLARVQGGSPDHPSQPVDHRSRIPPGLQRGGDGPQRITPMDDVLGRARLDHARTGGSTGGGEGATTGAGLDELRKYRHSCDRKQQKAESEQAPAPVHSRIEPPASSDRPSAGAGGRTAPRTAGDNPGRIRLIEPQVRRRNSGGGATCAVPPLDEDCSHEDPPRYGHERLFPHISTNARSMSIGSFEQMFAFCRDIE